jgi:hypothetical protein
MLGITQKKAAEINQLISDIKTGKIDEPTARKRAKIVIKHVSSNSPQWQELQEIAQKAGIPNILQDQTIILSEKRQTIKQPELEEIPIIGQEAEKKMQKPVIYTQQEQITNQEKLKSLYNTIHSMQPGTTEHMKACQQIADMKKEIEKKIQTLHTQKTSVDTQELTLILELLKEINALVEYATLALYSALNTLDDEAHSQFRTIPEWQELSRKASYISDSLRHLSKDYTKAEEFIQLCHEMILIIQKNMRRIQASKEQKST